MAAGENSTSSVIVAEDFVSRESFAVAPMKHFDEHFRLLEGVPE